MQYTYGILASHKKEQNWAIFSDVDESEYGTQSEVRKRKTSYINVHMWKLKKKMVRVNPFAGIERKT